MPIPETPYTRKEAYLNAIATGDSGGIPETPYTREEMYLDAIAKGGGGGGGGSSTLSGLTDVDITNPSEGQILVYDSASSKWVNGSGRLVVRDIYDEQSYTHTLDKTWKEIKDAMLSGTTVSIASYVDLSDEFERYEEWRHFPVFTVKSVIPVDSSDQPEYSILTAVDSYVTNSENGYPSYG